MSWNAYSRREIIQRQRIVVLSPYQSISGFRGHRTQPPSSLLLMPLFSVEQDEAERRQEGTGNHDMPLATQTRTSAILVSLRAVRVLCWQGLVGDGLCGQDSHGTAGKCWRRSRCRLRCGRLRGRLIHSFHLDDFIRGCCWIAWRSSLSGRRRWILRLGSIRGVVQDIGTRERRG